MRPRPRTQEKGIAQSTVLYATGAITGKVAGVALLPILARGLGPSEYGIFDIVSTIGSTITVILLLGLDAAATRMASGPDEGVRREVFAGWLLIAIAVGVSAGLVLLAASPMVSGLAIGSDAASSSIRLLAFIVPAGILNIVGLTAFRVQGRAWSYAILTGGTLVLNATLAAIAVGPLQLGIVGALAAWLVAVSTSAVVGLLHSGVRPHVPIDGAIAKRLLSFGLPLVPAVALALGADLANRLILFDAVGATQVGILSVALRLVSIIALVSVATNLAWLPMTYAASDDGQVGKAVLRPAIRSIGIMLAIAIAVSWISGAAAALLSGPGFEGVAMAVGPLAIGAVASGALPIVGVASALVYRSSDIGVATIVGSLVGVACNLALAPRLGLSGSAVSIGAGQVASLIVMAGLARRRPAISFPFARVAAAGAIASIAVIGLALGPLDGVMAAAWVAGGAALALFVTWSY